MRTPQPTLQCKAIAINRLGCLVLIHAQITNAVKRVELLDPSLHEKIAQNSCCNSTNYPNLSQIFKGKQPGMARYLFICVFPALRFRTFPRMEVSLFLGVPLKSTQII